MECGSVGSLFSSEGRLRGDDEFPAYFKATIKQSFSRQTKVCCTLP